jgi:hypothetical protein
MDFLSFDRVSKCHHHESEHLDSTERKMSDVQCRISSQEFHVAYVHFQNQPEHFSPALHRASKTCMADKIIAKIRTVPSVPQSMLCRIFTTHGTS